LIMLLVFIALAPTSCDYIIEKNDSDYEISSNAKTKINIYKREAKLLLKASKNNLDILELCETIINVDTQNSVSYLTSKLEKVHFEISKNYDDIANDKLISIPRYTKIDAMFKEIKGVEQATFIESNLKLILNKTEAQIQLLDTLGNVT